jgi:hypothetical protein
MDDEVSVEAILDVIEHHDGASLDSLLDELTHLARPADVARSFQTARALRLIEQDGRSTREGDPNYRLTRAGRVALGASNGSPTHGVNGSPVQPAAGPVSVKAVLHVVEDFVQASLGLVAWELCLSESDVAPAWELALEQGLLELGAFDALHREQMASLTDSGRERLGRPGELSG